MVARACGGLSPVDLQTVAKWQVFVGSGQAASRPTPYLVTQLDKACQPLPAHRSTMPAPDEPVNESPKQPPGKVHILIADDASGMRTYLRTILAGVGHDVTEAVDGGEAFDAIMRERFDLLITDLDMPGMDGFQLISAVSLLPESRGRPQIIVCSALLDESLAERRPELRLASVLLAKPVQPEDVFKAVEKAMKERKKQR
jgi:CheY-like chemotaxis protein